MSITKIIKITIAGVIAILLTGGILYFKLATNKAGENPPAQILEENLDAQAGSSEKNDEEKLYESISAPVAENAIDNSQESDKIDPDVQASISAPVSKTNSAQPEISPDILKSLSAPVK
jgi:hypothetical protein